MQVIDGLSKKTFVLSTAYCSTVLCRRSSPMVTGGTQYSYTMSLDESLSVRLLGYAIEYQFSGFNVRQADYN